MNFAETEGTGITQRAETEGTGISRSLTRLMTMGFMLMLMAPMAMAGELRLFSHDQEYVKGIYSEGTQAVFVEGLIVGNQLHLANAQFRQNLCPNAVVALIHLVAELQIGIDGIVTFLLQFVRPQFPAQPNATAFLTHIHQGTPTFALNHLHRRV